MKFRKMSACFAALTLAASMIPSAYAATYSADYNDNFEISATEKTNIEVEDAFHYLGDYGSNYFQNDAAASGGKYWQSGYWDSKEQLLTNKINVTEAGDYEVHFVSLQRANNLSAVILKVDDEVIGENFNNKDTTRTNIPGKSSLIQEAGWTDGDGVFHFYNDYFSDYSKVVTLSEGTHTITLIMNFYNGVNRIAGAIDNITFEKLAGPEPIVVSDEGNTYEVEDVFDVGIDAVDNANASGGKLVSSGWETKVKNSTREIDVEEAGYYELHFVMNSQDAYNNFDDIKVNIDGETILNNDRDSTTDKEALGWSTFYGMYDYSDTIYLSAGIHEVEVKFAMKGNQNRHALSMDTISFVPTEAPAGEFGWDYGEDTEKAGYKIEELGFVWKQIVVENAGAAVNPQAKLTSGNEVLFKTINFGEIDDGAFSVAINSTKDAVDFEIITD